MRWWLISDETIQKIQEALKASTHEANDYNCQDHPIGEECRGCIGDGLRKEAIHILDSGLHKTNKIPEDWMEEGL